MSKSDEDARLVIDIWIDVEAEARTEGNNARIRLRLKSLTVNCSLGPCPVVCSKSTTHSHTSSTKLLVIERRCGLPSLMWPYWDSLRSNVPGLLVILMGEWTNRVLGIVTTFAWLI